MRLITGIWKHLNAMRKGLKRRKRSNAGMRSSSGSGSSMASLIQSIHGCWSESFAAMTIACIKLAFHRPKSLTLDSSFLDILVAYADAASDGFRRREVPFHRCKVRPSVDQSRCGVQRRREQCCYMKLRTRINAKGDLYPYQRKRDPCFDDFSTSRRRPPTLKCCTHLCTCISLSLSMRETGIYHFSYTHGTRS